MLVKITSFIWALMVCLLLVSCDNNKLEELVVEDISSTEVFPLNPLLDEPGKLIVAGSGQYKYYIPSKPENIYWGYLPNAKSKPILTVPSGSDVVIDTISHEGILEDQGRDPIAYFKSKGIADDLVLKDVVELAASSVSHDFQADGPHIVTGPIFVEDAKPGDVLLVEILNIVPRVPYGVISNRHGKGGLPGEYPLGPKPETDASKKEPNKFRNVSIFVPTVREEKSGTWFAVLKTKKNRLVKIPTNPFMGIMGVALNTEKKIHSVPPGIFGGNLDINDLTVGSKLYLPVFVDGAGFYTGDPHMVQGDGEVALTALEQSLRVTLKLSLLKKGSPDIPSTTGSLSSPFAETEKYWIAVGLHEDLDEAMKMAIRESIRFLHEIKDLSKQTALAYLSAATDFQVSQVVDKVKGVHSLIRKSDFSEAEIDDAVED